MLKMNLSSNINVDGLKACQNQPLLIFLFKTIATAKVNSTIKKNAQTVQIEVNLVHIFGINYLCSGW